MCKKVLFSPVGGTDPIKYFRDGAMLHILRVYKPDVIYLYLSKEMCELHEKDNRYLYCIEKLGELLNHKFETKLLLNKDLKEVQNFDSIYENFNNKIIPNIKLEHENAILYLNVSSGTPAMKSALQTMATFSEFKMIPIQVSTPIKKMNVHEDDGDDYDVEFKWELNEDNAEDFEIRCIESKSENLLAEIKKKIIKKHIDAYDYVAALAVAEDMKDFLPNDVYKLLRAANYRLQLNFKEIDRELQGLDYQMLPVKDFNKRLIIEYILWLKIQLIKNEYADFIRGITPVIADLFELVLKNKCNIEVDKYCTKKTNRNKIVLRKWDRKKLLQNPELLDYLDKCFDGFRENDIAPYQMSAIIEKYCDIEKVIKTVNDLKDIEQKVRHLAAHEIVSVTDEWIFKQTNFKPEEILNKLKYIANVLEMNVNDDLWNSYVSMNETIKNII